MCCRDVFGDLVTQSRQFLDKSFARINQEGQGVGVLVYIRASAEPSRSFRRVHQSQTEKEIDKDCTTSLDSKDYGVGAQILRALGIKKIILLTNTHTKRVGLKGYGIEIIGEEALSPSKRLKSI